MKTILLALLTTAFTAAAAETKPGAANLSSNQAGGAKTAALFPFVLPWDDATPGIVDLSGWLHKPAGKFGHVRAGADGHLYAGQERIRFFGVDLAFSANFPRTRKPRRSPPAWPSSASTSCASTSWTCSASRKGFSPGMWLIRASFDPEALDRLDYFTAQLHRHGIYVNLCLLNYRPFNAADGLPKEIEQAGATRFKGGT